MSAAIDNQTNVIRKLKKLIRESSASSFRLRDLPDLHLFKLYQMFRSGESLKSCAKYLQDNGHLRTSSIESATKLVEKVKKRVAPLLVSVSNPDKPKKTSSLPPIRPAIQSGDIERIDQIAELYGNAIRDELENNAGEPLSANLSRHVTAFGSLLKVKTEIAGKQPKKDRDSESRETAGKLEKMIGQLPDKGLRVAQLAAKLVEEMEDDCILCEQNEDGSFVEVK